MLTPLALLLLTLHQETAALPVDTRCAPDKRAAAFSKKGLPKLKDAQRLDALVEACALPEVTALAARLIAFKTVSEDDKPASNGPEAQALGDFLKAWSTERGFSFRVVGKNDVFEISWGDGAPLLGFVTHGDVVPVNPPQWKHDPFSGLIEKGVLYGRGSEDDKGPLATVLVSMALARELGLKPRGRVVVMVGMGEEGAWEGMKAYADKEPKPTHVVSLDANFPTVFAQFGFVAWGLEAPVGALTDKTRPVIVDVRAGEFLTQVPGQASLTVIPPVKGNAAELEKTVRAEIQKLGEKRADLRAFVTRDGDRVTVSTTGKAAHSSTADEGHNALWDLAAVSVTLGAAPNGVSAMLDTVARRFDGDHWGKKLGVAYSDEMMGDLMVAPTLLSVKDGKVLLGVNMRRPRGMDAAAFKEKLKQAASDAARESGGGIVERTELYVGDPHVADTSGPLVNTLMDIYRRREKAPDAKPIAIRGGTYARLFPGSVDFGPSFPGEPYLGHGVDESISLSTLQKMTAMVAEALFTLSLSPTEK